MAFWRKTSTAARYLFLFTFFKIVWILLEQLAQSSATLIFTKKEYCSLQSTGKLLHFNHSPHMGKLTFSKVWNPAYWEQHQAQQGKNHISLLWNYSLCPLKHWVTSYEYQVNKDLPGIISQGLLLNNVRIYNTWRNF